MAHDERSLYRLLPSSFVAGRNTLAKALKKAGHKAEGARIAKLPKPSSALWAVNQLSKEAPDELQAYITAHHRARTRQLRALESTENPEASRLAATAIRQERNLLENLLRKVHTLLVHANFNPTKTVIEQARSNLRAAVASAPQQLRLIEGWLDHDLSEPGFDQLTVELCEARPVWLEQQLTQLRASPTLDQTQKTNSITNTYPYNLPNKQQLRVAEQGLHHLQEDRIVAERRVQEAKLRTDQIADHTARLKAEILVMEAELEEAQSEEALRLTELREALNREQAALEHLNSLLKSHRPTDD
ncbi:MAG: hypothetical protein KTR25_08000 [Myxococcales bacterium]|nr:hypothetical protein [Myxococcales bacterium]